jgi:hypothetical protein
MHSGVNEAIDREWNIMTGLYLKSEFFEFKRVFCLDRDILLYKNRIQIKFSYRSQDNSLGYQFFRLKDFPGECIQALMKRSIVSGI